jgi:predicted methyltransferase
MWGPSKAARRSLNQVIALAVAIAAATGAGCFRRRVGPNDAYYDPRVGAERWRQLFEGEDREIYRQRARIMQLAAVTPGMSVVDVGAGTGLFSMLLSDAVGETGRVYAEEIMEKFSSFIAARAEHERRANVVSVMGTETSIGLPPASVDFVFACDVYHHFDHPAQMLASMHRALRPGGEMLLVDFTREPGLSPAWILEHVRAGRQQVLREVEAAGFTLVSTDDSVGINYALRFRRAPEARP